MLRSLILEELPLAQRFVRAGEEVVPRFIVLAPDAQFMIIGPLPDETPARLERLQLIRGVMVSKAASGFVHASELREPDAIVALAMKREDVVGGLQRITRRPLMFSEPEWFGREGVGDEFIELLSRAHERLSEDQARFVERALAGEIAGVRWAAVPDKR